MSELSDDAILAYGANILDLEDARDAVQGDLKDAWAHIREAHGKRFADALKLAVKRARMDHDKRQQADEIDAEAERILGVLNAGPRVRVARGAREALPLHDADGVVIEDEEIDLKGLHGVAFEAVTAAEEINSFPADTEGSRSTRGADVGVGGEASSTAAANSNSGAPSPEDQNRGAEVRSAAPALVAIDRSKPNPICQDPEDCGDASWTHPCGSCLRRRDQLQAARAMQ